VILIVWLVAVASGTGLTYTSGSHVQQVEPAPASAVVSGRVVTGDRKSPVDQAIVTLVPDRGVVATGLKPQIVGGDGRFEFSGLSPGTYSVVARASGYFTGAFGRSTPYQNGAKLPVAAGKRYDDIEIQLNAAGAISGRVIDESGDPIVGAHVRALTRVTVGENHWLSSSVAVRTDDRGMYRLSDLRAATYVVEVPFASSVDASGAVFMAEDRPIAPADADGRPRTYATTFFPSATDVATARSVAVGSGEQHRGIDIVVGAVVPRRVSGVVFGGVAPVDGMTLRLTIDGLESLGEQGAAATTVVDARGGFNFGGVPPGRYLIETNSSSARLEQSLSGRLGYVPLSPKDAKETFSFVPLLNGPIGTTLVRTAQMDSAMWARMPVLVADADADVEGLSVALESTSMFSGRFVRDDERVMNSPASVLLSPLSPGAPALNSQPTFDEMGVFRVSGIPAGRYVISVIGGTLRSIRCGARDLTTTPIEFPVDADLPSCVATLTTSAAVIDGRVDLVGGSSADLGVVVFPVSRQQWATLGLRPANARAIPVAHDGTFRFADLPEGDFYVAAIDVAQLDQWTTPDVLQRLAVTATRVHVDWGATASAILKAPRRP
jgi:hypothetical protein